MRLGLSPAHLDLVPHSNPLQRNIIASLTRRLAITALYACAHALTAGQYPLPGIRVIENRKWAGTMAPRFEHRSFHATLRSTANCYEVGRVEVAQPTGPPVGRLARPRREHPTEDGLRHRPEEGEACAHNCTFSLNYC